MFFEKKLKLIQEKIKLFPQQLILPIVIPLIAIFTIFLTFVIFAQRILFIYDPYTIRISNYNISQIKKTGIRHNLFVKFVAANYEDFPEIYKNISEKQKRKNIVITSYLYSMFKDDKEYEDFFNNSRLHIYGPLFDYLQSDEPDDPIAVSVSISNKEKIKNFLKECEELVFFIPESIYGKADFIEPEKTLISLLTENFYSLKNDGNVIKSSLSEKMGKDSVSFNNNSIIVLCFRKISPGARSLITESGGKVVFFDYINGFNLKKSLYINKDAAFSLSLSYDYKYTLDKIFKNIGENPEKRINYMAVFSFFP